MCAAACTVTLAGARSSAGSAVHGRGVKEGRSPKQWIGNSKEEEPLSSEAGKHRVRPRDAGLQAEECTPTKRIGGLSGDGKNY